MQGQCRFCLETTSSVENPLISPCKCSGSIKYVHSICINKWLLINRDPSKFTCSICKELFKIDIPPKYLEKLPDSNMVAHFLLQFPIVILFLLKYALLLILISDYITLGTLTDSYIQRNVYRSLSSYTMETCIVFNIIYFTLAFNNTDIIRVERYWDISKYQYRACTIFHLILIAFIYSGNTVMLYNMGYFAHIFWRVHCDTVRQINSEVMQELEG